MADRKKNKGGTRAGSAKRARKAKAPPGQKYQAVQASLKEAQDGLWETILEALPHPFYVIDARDYSIILANSAAGSTHTPDLSTCHALTHRLDIPCSENGCLCPLEEVKKSKKSVVVEHVHYDMRGEARHVEVHGHPVLDSAGNVVQMIEYCLDITERKRAEEERLQKEKLQGVIETAGAACHELNQPMQALFAYLHIALKKLSKDDPLYDPMQQIKHEVNRIARITHKLKNITRYESQDYFRGAKIIDIDKASE